MESVTKSYGYSDIMVRFMLGNNKDLFNTDQTEEGSAGCFIGKAYKERHYNVPQVQIIQNVACQKDQASSTAGTTGL